MCADYFVFAGINGTKVQKEDIAALPQCSVADAQSFNYNGTRKAIGLVNSNILNIIDGVCYGAFVTMIGNANEALIEITNEFETLDDKVRNVAIKNIQTCVPLLITVMSRECAAIVAR